MELEDLNSYHSEYKISCAEIPVSYSDTHIQNADMINQPNLKVHNSTHVLVEGIFLGDRSMWKEAVEMSGATESTPITSIDLMNAARVLPFQKAVNSLVDWKPNIKASTMIKPFQGEVRTYFKYKSLFLFEPLPEDAIQILIDEAMYIANVSTSNSNVKFYSCKLP